MATVFKAHLMQRLVASRASKSKKNVLQQGFTLVELMIVVVIVGILSAVALPNFMNQTAKAKATEAKTLVASALKEAMAAYAESGTAGIEDWRLRQCPKDTKMFTFTCDDAVAVEPKVIASGTPDSGELDGKVLEGLIYLDVDSETTGQIKMCGTAPGVEEC